MRNITLFILLLSSCYSTTLASPPELEIVWAQFQAAVQNSDVDRLGTMTRSPLKSNLSTGPIKNINNLKQQFNHIFQPIMINNINKKQPKKDKHYKVYVVDFGSDNIPLIFGFEKSNNNYKWTYIEDFH